MPTTSNKPEELPSAEDYFRKQAEYRKQKDRERFRTRDGMSERQLKRIANRKPRKKIKKL